MSSPVQIADYVPVTPATVAGSYSPIELTVPDRPVPMELRIAVPVVGDGLPIILLSHGHGSSNYLSSRRGYGPLVDFYASHGFAVIQPTHLDSKALGLPTDGPEGALYWRSRATDMKFILDHLDQVEASIPGLAGRLDRDRIAVVGHSLGGLTAAMLAGMRVTDPVDNRTYDLSDSRVKAAVMLAPPGDGKDIAKFVAEHYPVLGNNDFTTMTTQGLVVAGDKDFNPDFSARRDWRSDAYHLSPSPKCLLTLFDGEHQQGGISGYDAKETTDENTERASLVERTTWAYLRTALNIDSDAWAEAMKALSDQAGPIGQVACK